MRIVIWLNLQRWILHDSEWIDHHVFGRDGPPGPRSYQVRDIIKTWPVIALFDYINIMINKYFLLIIVFLRLSGNAD